MKIDPQCPLCCAAKESHEHLFMFCPVTQLLWFASPPGIHIPNDLNMLDWIQHCRSTGTSKMVKYPYQVRTSTGYMYGTRLVLTNPNQVLFG
jgi:hypothetical protein